MAKRKDITNLDDLLGGKAGATGTGPTKGAAPTPAPTEQSRPFSFRLPADLATDFDHIVQAERVSQADLIRFALGRFVEDYKAGKVKLPKEQRFTLKR
jgi:hypothetical protein